jgi:hypothetical protein
MTDADVQTRAFRALRNLGFREREVRRALAEVTAQPGHVPQARGHATRCLTTAHRRARASRLTPVNAPTLPSLIPAKPRNYSINGKDRGRLSRCTWGAPC